MLLSAWWSDLSEKSRHERFPRAALNLRIREGAQTKVWLNPKHHFFFTQIIIFHGGTAILSSLFFVVKSGPLETFSEPCDDRPVVLVDLGLALACVSDGERAAVIYWAGRGAHCFHHHSSWSSLLHLQVVHLWPLGR